MQYDSHKLWELISNFGDAMHKRALYLSTPQYEEYAALSEKLREEIWKICFEDKTSGVNNDERN